MGIPMNETAIADSPAPPAPNSAKQATPMHGDQNDINVFLTGKRLQISADIDAAGVERMRDVLAKYEEILNLLK